MGDRDVLVLTPTFHPEKVGTPHYVTDMVEEMVRQGLHVRVVTNQPYYPTFQRFPGYGRATRRDQVGQVPVDRLPTLVPRDGARLARILSEANMLLQVVVGLLSGRLRRSGHVLAISPGAPFAIVAGALLRRRRARFTVVVHDIGFGLARTTGGRMGRTIAAAIRWIEVRALNLADRVIVLSDAMGHALARQGVRVGLETVELWPTVGGASDVAPAAATVQYSGNLGRKQGVHRLLDLADRLGGDAPDATVVIRGDGSEAPTLRRDAERRGLANVDFRDFVAVEELASRLAEARVHVVPQLPESADFAVPSKIVNILAVGRPVVVTATVDSPLGQLASRCSAVRIVDPEDDQAFATEVARVLRLDELSYAAMCKDARRWAEQHDRVSAVKRTIEGCSGHARGLGSPSGLGSDGRGARGSGFIV